MDLTIPLESITLNIRVAILVKQDGCYILEKSKGGYYFPVGGRVKAGETSLQAAKREVSEELGVTVEGLTLKAIVETFFGRGNERVQEICFVYTAKDVEGLTLSSGFEVCALSDIDRIDFRPRVIKEAMKSSDDRVLHLMVSEE